MFTDIRKGNEAAMKIKLDLLRCEANAVCVRECPEVFELKDDATLRIKSATVTPEQRSAVERAVSCCPRQALKLED